MSNLLIVSAATNMTCYVSAQGYISVGSARYRLGLSTPLWTHNIFCIHGFNVLTCLFIIHVYNNPTEDYNFEQTFTRSLTQN